VLFRSSRDSQPRRAPRILVTATTEVVRGRSRVRVNEAYTDALLADRKSVVDAMQTRADLYEVLDYHAYERKLDELFARDKSK